MNELVSYQGRGEVQGEIVRPTAAAGPQPSAVYNLGELLKNMLHKSVGVFHNEGDLLKGLDVVDAFVKAFVPGSAVNALSTGDQMAPREDVSQRIPPNQTGPVVPAAPGIDYEKLAQAIVSVQQRQRQENQ